ncbi:MAG: hypothetical protein K9M98_04435 [Cephaloticoccus sp.]|nr:hypothetical protein [Cephaloticoccus sp.]MCF7759731.1 hypothetical protein [Cephaloticoccus sp.]
MDASHRMRGIYFGCSALAGITVLVWLWINFCRFPNSSWNDIRLVPVFMAAMGEAVYNLPGSGVITTWMYGPVPLWLWSPALLGTTPSAALLIADGVNLGLTLGAIALTCAYWPCPEATRTLRWTALIATIAVWPDHAFGYLQADNVAVVFALLGNLLLVTNHGSSRSWKVWLAALATVLALGSKQTMLGVLLAQLIWLRLTHDWRTTLTYLGRTALCGLIMAGIAIAQFGLAPLWFGIVKTAAALPMVEDYGERLGALAPILSVQWGVPVGALIMLGKKLLARDHILRLPLLAWLCSLPLSIFGLLTTGGSTNNLYGWQMLAAPVLLCLLKGWHENYRSTIFRVWPSAAVIGVICLRIVWADHAPIRPDTGIVQQAVAIQASLPRQVWLPWNPLVSWFADRKFYHAEDGMYVRFITGHSITVTQARAHLPEHFHAMAFPSPLMQWGIAAKLSPVDHVTRHIGGWEILLWDPASQ